MPVNPPDRASTDPPPSRGAGSGYRVTGALVARRDGLLDDVLDVADGRLAGGEPGDALRIHLPGHAVFPGLVNAHDHLHLNAVAELRCDRTFRDSSEWIRWVRGSLERESALPGLAAPSRVRYWHGALKNVLAGATSVVHHDPRDPALDDPGFPVRVPEIGWCHSLALAGEYGPGVAESLRETAPGRPWMIHLAEGTGPSARGELARLESIASIGPRTVLVHGVGLDDDGLRRVLEAGAACVWCPSSNLTILGTTLEPEPLAAAGRLALGTDSRLSGSRDLLDELRVARRHSGLGGRELLRLVGLDAARLIGLDDVGRLEAGCRADLVVVRAGDDAVETLLAAGRADLRAVVVGGRPVVADRDLRWWCDACGVDVVEAVLDGRPKVLATDVLGPPAAARLEPGLELSRPGEVVPVRGLRSGP